jgi:sugar/nucleoside kinase (ribokinase family)
VAAAALYAYLHDYPLAKLLLLANATGAAAVQKLGAGANVPNRAEIQAVLQSGGLVFDF